MSNIHVTNLSTPNTREFNSHHTNCRYTQYNEQREQLTEWTERNNLILGYNPDLTFVSMGNETTNANREVLHDFPKSQHIPIITSTGTTIPMINSISLPIGNFRKPKLLVIMKDLSFWPLVRPKTHTAWWPYIPCWSEEYAKIYTSVMNKPKILIYANNF